MTRIYGDSPEDIAEVCDLLANGGIVALPTETVYGLAANARDPIACRRVFEIKGRPFLDPLIVHVPDLEGAETLAYMNPEAKLLASEFWPGPLTIVLPRKLEVPDIVTAGLPSVAVRMSSHPLLRGSEAQRAGPGGAQRQSLWLCQPDACRTCHEYPGRQIGVYPGRRKV